MQCTSVWMYISIAKSIKMDWKRMPLIHIKGCFWDRAEWKKTGVMKQASPAQFSSVQSLSCVWLCDPMNHSTPRTPVHHQFPESTQTHVHWVNDAIQPSHPLSSPSPPALNISQHKGLYQWVSSLHQVTKVLESQLQHQSFQWTPGLMSFRMDWVDLVAVQGTLKSLSPTPQFKSISSLMLSFPYSPPLTSIHDYWKNHSLD